MSEIYLCHKCEGVLQGYDSVPQPTYNCHCISGYVRDFQQPTPVDRVRPLQIQRQRDWLALFDRQGRAATDARRIEVIKLLADLEKGA